MKYLKTFEDYENLIVIRVLIENEEENEKLQKLLHQYDFLYMGEEGYKNEVIPLRGHIPLSSPSGDVYLVIYPPEKLYKFARASACKGDWSKVTFDYEGLKLLLENPDAVKMGLL